MFKFFNVLATKILRTISHLRCLSAEANKKTRVARCVHSCVFTVTARKKQQVYKEEAEASLERFPVVNKYLFHNQHLILLNTLDISSHHE